MNARFLEQYLNRLHREMVQDMSSWLKIEGKVKFVPLEVWGLAACYTVNKINEPARIYIPGRKDDGRDLTEREIAQAEIECVHETGHILHQYANPILFEQLDKEDAIVERFDRKNTPNRFRCFTLIEFMAEYLGLLFIDLRQGVKKFSERYGPKDFAGDDTYGIAFNLIKTLPQHQAISLAERAVTSTWAEASGIPDPSQIVNETEEKISHNPQAYSPPYQLGFFGPFFYSFETKKPRNRQV